MWHAVDGELTLSLTSDKVVRFRPGKPVSLAAFQLISKNDDLTGLIMIGGQVTDSQLAYLSNLRQLQLLNLSTHMLPITDSSSCGA
jgi:hypothetical protein